MPDIPAPVIVGGRTLVKDGYMQGDLDATNHKILHLDTSNLHFDLIPSQSAPPHQWYNSYDVGTHHFGSTQPNFLDIAGNLSSAQQLAITELGTIHTGTWEGSIIQGFYLDTLDQIRRPVNNVDLNNKKATNLADAIDPQDAVNLRLLEQITGQNPKAAVRCASVAAILPTGLPVVDGIQVVAGDRVLIKSATAERFAGIWTAAAGVWTRTTDADTGAELVLASTFVLEGTENAGSTFLQTTPAPIIVDTTPLLWVLISRSLGGNITAGPGLQRIGNQISAVGTTDRIDIGTGIDISATYVGQNTITTVGSITSGSWLANVISGKYGGTGVDNTGRTITLAGNLATELALDVPPGTPLTLTLAGSTNVTLPVTGTLATLGGVETFTNKHISGEQIDSGFVAVAVGGTGAGTPDAAVKNLLPDQTGHAGEVLHTDGSNTYWAPVFV